MKTLLGLVGFGALTGVTALLGARTTWPGLAWYDRLEKPAFQPPEQAFGPVWTTLYAAIAISGWRVWRRAATPERQQALRWWLAQLALNGLWPWLFFEQRRPATALADSALLTGAVAAYTRAASRVDRAAAWLTVPYLAWSAFATALNAEIVRLNPNARKA